MIPTKSSQSLSLVALVLALLLCLPGFTRAEQNQVMGEVKFSGMTKIEKNSGVWIDGQYVGYLKEKPERAAVFVDDGYIGHAADFGGSFHSMLLSPGKHRLKVELPGYRTF